MGAIANVLRGLCVTAALVASGAAGADLGTRTSSAAGVTVNVTPKAIQPGAPDWEFGVVLTTHSGDLGDDLVKSSVILDAQGARHPALAWQGSPPGGHHRSGVLRFKGLANPPDVLELQIRRPGEPGPRSFRWKLK